MAGALQEGMGLLKKSVFQRDRNGEDEEDRKYTNLRGPSDEALQEP